MTDAERIRYLQREGPWLALSESGAVRSIEPGSPAREGETVVQVLGAKGLKEAKATLKAADRWNAMSEDQREALLEADVQTYGRLRLAAKKIKAVD